MSSLPALPRRRFQFSLRSLAVVVTLACLAMAYVHRARDQQRAIAALRASNPAATIEYGHHLDAGAVVDPNDRSAIGWLKRKLGADLFETVDAVELFYPVDDDLRAIGRLTNLRRLSLQRAVDLTDAGLAHLAPLHALRWLVLADADRLTDAGLAHLERLSGLEHLTLQISPRRVSAAAIAKLRRALPRCEIRIFGESEPSADVG